MLTLGLSLVPRVEYCHLGPGLSSSFYFRWSSWKNCFLCVWVCCVVTGMVQVPVYHGGADRRPSNRRVAQSDDDSHTHAREILAWRLVCCLDVVVDSLMG